MLVSISAVDVVDRLQRGYDAATIVRLTNPMADSPKTDVEDLRQILTETKTIAVVGLSANESRPSFFASKYMLDHGYKIIPVNPRYEEVLGQTCYPDLESIPCKVDMVDVFQRADRVLPTTESAVKIGAKTLWLQLGVVNNEAAKLAANAGLNVVMDKCVKIEYARLFGGLGLVGVSTGIISAKRPRNVPY